MKITINYRTICSKDTKELILLPEEYFDLPTEKENGYSIDSIAKFIFPYEYIKHELPEIIFLTLNIEDSKSYSKRELFFWNKGKNSTDYVSVYDAKKSEIFEWMITTTVTTNERGNDIEESLRLYKNENNMWVVKNHSYRTILPVGSEDIVEEMDVHNKEIGSVSGFRTVYDQL
jgi:hypothetical protein